MRKQATEAAKYAMLRALSEDEGFGGVPAPVLQALVEHAAVIDERKGAIIYDVGQVWERVGFIIDGAVAMLAIGDAAKAHLYDHLGAGQFFGVSSMFDGKPEMARTQVVSRRARYAMFEADFVVALCRKNGTLAMAFANVLARRVRRTTSLLAAQMNLSAQERIARYLLQFASEGSGLAPAREPLPLMTQAQIGAAAGTVKDVAARTIGLFERRGAVKRRRGHVHYLDRRALAALARLIPG